MNTHKTEQLLLLQETGELTPEDATLLEEHLKTHPDPAGLAEELRMLQEAARLSRTEEVPPLDDLTRERILRAAHQPSSRLLPRVLALAALLILGLSLLPHFLDTHQTPAPPVQAAVEPVRPTLGDEDPILQDLEELNSELTLLSHIEGEDPAFLESENDWAETLIPAEDAT